MLKLLRLPNEEGERRGKFPVDRTSTHRAAETHQLDAINPNVKSPSRGSLEDDAKDPRQIQIELSTPRAQCRAFQRILGVARELLQSPGKFQRSV